ncbi:MAG TPA: HAD family phosphatase [Anaerolineae bacterium]|nr:HAD family phosphatase [Anaerolineae bacterium]
MTITTLFFDVGGVLLTNAWDTAARKRAVDKFRLEWQEFESRHEMLKYSFETGRIRLDEYVQRSIFRTPRDFTPDEFKQFMFQQSQPLPGGLDCVRALKATGRYRLLMLNNESLELNEYRLKTFGLTEYFDDFFSSCYVGRAKPDQDIYRIALQVTHVDPMQAIFIDDRAVNLESAWDLGLHAVRYEGAAQLMEYLAQQGVTV